ncbi:MAG: hypothetical protein Ta2B_17900 [Termitinemataceae bacterium]|nr:MAG: hypothetical protein Ta2B_17900 [Termitinemataceae bacterium]
MEINYVIVQAGGKGTRLGKYTRNKPKPLVPYKNLPIIFHLFKSFQNACFIILGDYQFSVLDKYLQTFSNARYILVHAEGDGNVCGINLALSFIENDAPFMLIWSDIILPEQFGSDKLEKGCYVGVSESFQCSWSFIDGKLEKSPTVGNGVAGLFLFDKKEYFASLPNEGSFTQWLQRQNLLLRNLNLIGCHEIGTLDALKETDYTKNRCRPYNRMEFTDKNVIKCGITEAGEKLIDFEILWYKEMEMYGFRQIPKIYSYEPLTMEKIDGVNIFSASVDDNEKKEIIDRLVDSLKTLHGFGSEIGNAWDLEAEYFTKTMKRLWSIRNVIPFADDPYIVINGKKCRNILVFPEILQKEVGDKLFNTFFCPIHGDSTFTNTLIDNNKNIFFIDARGYFGSKEIIGDVRYDWAKLYYSINGNFDQFNIRNFDLTISDTEVNYRIQSNGYEHLTEYFLSRIPDCNILEIKLIHSIIWLSLASHAWEDYDSLCLSFYNGLWLFDEYMNSSGNITMSDEILKLSILNKTWIFDFDGTLVEHNGYKYGEDKFLPGVEALLKSIPSDDFILIMTAREEKAREKTEKFLQDNGIRYNEILFEIPMGERILVNDSKPSGLKMAYAIACKRNQGLERIKVKIDKTL